jgi:hypothetical protein
MLKRLAMLCLFLVAMSPMPGWASTTARDGSDKGQDQGQGDKSTPAPASPHINKPIQPSPEKEHSGPVATEDAEYRVNLTNVPPVTIADKHKRWWEYMLEWGPWIFNFGLVVVGGFQVWLLRWTWKTIERQTDIQEAGMTQWVNVVPERIAVETKSTTFPPEKVTLHLYWRIVNDTSHPLTLQKIETKVARGEKQWDCFRTEPDEVIPPKAEQGQNFYVFYVEVSLDEGETREFLDKGKLFTIVGKAFYRQVSGKPAEQFFGDYYWCTPKEFKLSNPIGYGPDQQWVEEDEQPSRIRAEKLTFIEEVPDEPTPESNDPN